MKLAKTLVSAVVVGMFSSVALADKHKACEAHKDETSCKADTKNNCHFEGGKCAAHAEAPKKATKAAVTEATHTAPATEAPKAVEGQSAN